MRKPLPILALLALAAVSPAQVNFSLDFGASTTPEWKATFQQAADIWNSVLSGGSTGAPVNLRYKVDVGPVGAGTSGNTSSFGNTVRYDDFRSALAANPNKSALDIKALSYLETGPAYTVQANNVKVKTDANGDPIFDDTGRGVPDLDSHGDFQYVPGSAQGFEQMFVNSANMKALGMTPEYSGDFDPDGTGRDGYDALITFTDLSDWAPGDAIPFDFDRSDGIGTSNFLAYDALGIALHEIGHSLGFESQVDVRDYYIGYRPEEYSNNASALDMFRYEQVDGKWVRSVQIGRREERFSADGGEIGQRFSTGVMEGTGAQASHWYPNLLSGLPKSLMEPGIEANATWPITGADLDAFDAIGWNLAPQAVPEPATVAALGVGALALLRRRKR